MIWGRLEDWDDGVTATRSEPRRPSRRTLYFGATQWAGSLLRVDHRRIDRRRLPADQLVQVARSIRIRFGLITTPFRSSCSAFLDHESKEFGHLFQML